jgi:hypothetical protein
MGLVVANGACLCLVHGPCRNAPAHMCTQTLVAASEFSTTLLAQKGT